MTTAANIPVEQLASQQRKTKYGLKDVYSFKAGGQWYQTGFKKHGLNVGDVVTLDFTTDTYGNQVDMGSIKKTAGGATTASTSSSPPPANTSGSKSFSPSGGKGVFPIPALDGQRSIVRQNALTNARELVSKSFVPTANWPGSVSQHTLVADEIIRIAKRFEGYTAGDTDLAEVEAEIAEERKTK